MQKVVVKFVRHNGMYAPGDITQLDYEEAKSEEAKHRLVIISEETPAVETINNGELKNVIPPQDPKNELICPICGKVCKSKIGLIAHKRSHETK